MSEPGGSDLNAPDLTVSALTLLIADAVQRVPGVVRLEPTLGTAGPQGLYRRGPTDGVQVADRRGTVNVEVNIAVAAEHQARSVAEQLERCVVDLLRARRRAPGRVIVNILTLEDP